MTPYVYPEDFGAVGDGVTDDFGAILAALTAAAKNQSIFFSGGYATSKTINPGGVPVMASGNASLAGIGGCPTGFAGLAGATRHTLPALLNFSGPAVVQSNGVAKIECQKVSNCGSALALGPGAIDCDFYFHWLAGLTDCLEVSSSAGSPIQGNRMRVNFAVNCQNGLNFDGSPNCDANTLEFASWDAAGKAGSIWLNTGTAENPQPCSTWRLKVTDWIGGMPPSTGCVAKGAFQFCEFENALLNTSNWDAFAITGGGGNTFKTASATGFEAAFAANWQAAANSRAGFGAAWYTNTRLCKGRCAPMASGTLVTYYVYSPFVDGNSFGFRAMPVVNPGFELVSIVDNSSVHPNEVAITWRAVNQISPGAPHSYDEFDFQFTSGIP